MATKAERFRAAEERRHPEGTGASRASGKKSKKANFGRDKAHARAKATHALEPTGAGSRPSRKSTRGSANRAKSDAAFNLTEQHRKGSPEARARRTRAKAVKVRSRTRQA